MNQFVEVRVCGIPALARIDEARYTKPDHSTWASDWDYHGGWDLSWTLCDTRRRPAAWLERKAQPKDLTDIENQVIAYLEES